MSNTTVTRRHDVVVVGGSQAGLAIGYHLAELGVDFTIVDAASEPAAWPSIAAKGPVVLLTGASSTSLTETATVIGVSRPVSSANRSRPTPSTSRKPIRSIS